jgi:putative transposase
METLRSKSPVRLEQFGFQVFMSRTANCWNNAPMESFWGTLKNEPVHHRRFATRPQTIADITE